jgi:hypothetical protein
MYMKIRTLAALLCFGLFIAGRAPHPDAAADGRALRPRSAAQANEPLGAAASGRALVGTWTASRVERLDAAGAATAVPNPRGLLIFDAAGHVSEIVTRGDRVPYVAAQPTPAEAQRAFLEYADLWGRYRVDAPRRTIVYTVSGSVDPNLRDQEIQRAFTLAGDSLTVTSTTPRPDAAGGTRIRWDRVPTLDRLSDSHRALVGFWQHVVEQRVDLKDTMLSETRRSPSIIVYTPTGHIGVHFPPLNRTRLKGAWPTDEEAQAAVRGYVGYIAVFSLHPGAVFHHRLALLGRAQGDTLRRFYQIAGDDITLRFPPGQFQGQEARTVVKLHRMSGAAAMLGQ